MIESFQTSQEAVSGLSSGYLLGFEIKFFAESEITRVRAYLKEKLTPRREAFLRRALPALNEMISRHCSQALLLATVEKGRFLALSQSLPGEPDELFEKEELDELIKAFVTFLSFFWEVFEGFERAASRMWQLNHQGSFDPGALEIAFVDRIECYYLEGEILH